MIVRPQQHWLRRIFCLARFSIIQDILALTTQFFSFLSLLFSCCPWYTHLGIKFTLAPFSILGVAIAIFLGFRNNAGYARYVEARKTLGGS
ncbi:hypothetical protein HTY54_24180 [Escherichia coli]|nr:hypothetical protein [Escherichia coli]